MLMGALNWVNPCGRKLVSRKTKDESEATRVDILNAAELCFLQEGVFRTTLERIASRAGYSRGAVYWHFKNKLEVFDAVMHRIEEPMFVGLEQVALAVNDRPLRAFRQFIKYAFDDFARNPHARNGLEIMMFKCEFVEETRPILLRQQRINAVALGHMREIFRNAQRLRQLREGLDPNVCAMAIRYVIDGAIREWLLNPKTNSLQRDGLAVLDATLAGFAVEGALRDEDRLASDRPASRGGGSR
jgi:TetR/AcrR family transcriptional regulator, acrAB operon repressor